MNSTRNKVSANITVLVSLFLISSSGCRAQQSSEASKLDVEVVKKLAQSPPEMSRQLNALGEKLKPEIADLAAISQVAQKQGNYHALWALGVMRNTAEGLQIVFKTLEVKEHLVTLITEPNQKATGQLFLTREYLSALSLIENLTDKIIPALISEEPQLKEKGERISSMAKDFATVLNKRQTDLEAEFPFK